jgi:phosphoglucosamine mutase
MNTLFGTDGIRAAVGTPPLTSHHLVTLGSALGFWLTTYLKAQSIIIAHDTRISCPFIKAALKAGLLSFPLEVHDAHVLPTPALFYQVNQGIYDAGIMITASHNQYSDNGIKIFTKRGKLTADQEQTISDLFYKPLSSPIYTLLGTDHALNNPSYTYSQALFSRCTQQFLKGVSIVVDCANGAYTTIAPSVLERLGARVVAINNHPNGKNINDKCGSLYPNGLIKAVAEHHAHIGIAFDGDGDRITLVGKDGSVATGDDIVALLLQHPTYAASEHVIGTVMSNQGLELHVKQQNKQFHRTPVGDKHVLLGMKEHKTLLGAEPSGHVILKDFIDTADGLFTALRVLQVLVETGNWNVTTFTKMPQIVINMPITTKKDLSQQPYAQLIDAYQSQLLQGRILVRYSGTESVLRIMVEDTDEQHAYDIGKTLSYQLSKTIAEDML